MNATYRIRCIPFAVLALCLAVQAASAITVETLLAELPANDSVHAAQLYEQLAADDGTVIAALCDRVSLWTEGADPRVPTALHGLANHVMRPENTANQAKVARLFEAALNRVEDIEVKRYFMSLLRVCGDTDSLETLASYLCDATLYDDTIITVEAIGGDAAIALLKENKCANMPPAFSSAVETALMRMEGRVVLDKEALSLDREIVAATMTPPEKKNKKRVATLCRKALKNPKLEDHLHALALRALVNTVGADALSDLLEAGKSNKPVLWGMALQLSETLPGSDISKAWIRQLDSLPESVRPQVIYMLGGRNDRESNMVIQKKLRSETGDLLLAACDAFGRCEDKMSFLRSLEAAMLSATSRKEVEAVKAALLQIPEPELSELAARRALRGDTLQRVAYLGILTSRHAEQHLRPVRRCLKEDSAEIRRAALDALAVIGNNEDMDTVFEMFLAEEADRDATAARDALIAIAGRCESRPALLARMVKAFSNAAFEIQARLLKAFGALGDRKALAEVGKIADAVLMGEAYTEDLGNAVLETLGIWQDVRACDMLLELFERMERPATRTAILKQIAIAVPRIYTTPEKQSAFLEKTAALCKEESEKAFIAEALEKIEKDK